LNKTKALSTIIATIIVSGCSQLGMDFHGIKNPPIPQKWQHSNKNHKNSYVVSWWKSFNDPTLNYLIKKAYKQNLDIKSASMRILQARAMLGISEGLTFPQIQKLSGYTTKTHTKLLDIDTNNLSFDMGWELDIWGKYARGIESSQAQLYASVASYDNIIVSILSEVAKDYILYNTLQERLVYAQRNAIIQQRIKEMTQIQFKAGNVSELDVQQASTQLYNTQTAIYTLKISKLKIRNILAFLLAEDSTKIDKILTKNISKYKKANYFLAKYKGAIQLKEDYKALTNLHIIPKPKLNPYFAIDANLLTNRPDIKMAEHLVHSNLALIGATKAKLYPSFSLFGNIGYNANNKFGTWINGSDALSVTIGPSFSWDIFNYGRIKNQIRLQDAKFEESLFNYNKQVLLAVSEVSSALQSYQLTLKQLKESQKALHSSIRAFNISVIQYKEGLISYQRVLIAIEKLTLTQDRYASIKGDLALNAIALYKALGGGWQIREGKSYISYQLAQKMKNRTDWGHYLDTNITKLPKGFGYDK